MHVCRLIIVLTLLLNAGCEKHLATAPDQVPVLGGAQLALDTRQVQKTPGFLHPPGHQHPTVKVPLC